MKIISYNLNGIRASIKLGLLNWIENVDADIYCFQEVRAKEEVAKELLFSSSSQLDLFDTEIKDNKLNKYYPIFNCGKVAGYAGTMILTKIKPDKILLDMGDFWCDIEGRTTTIIIGKTAIVNSYVPNGNSRLDFKMNYLDALIKFIQFLQQDYSVILVGDFNIAHNEIDLTNPKECKNRSVFLPIERECFGKLLDLNLIDSFRYKNPEKIKYSWRSYRSREDTSYNSWKYRIDYIITSDDIKNKIIFADILEEPYSDHLPCVMDIVF